MQTKNIFKTLAFAMLMPTMLLTTACSSDDDFANDGKTANAETVVKKGYALPVTVSATRQDDGTRADYNESTRILSFSAGDKLFVEGSHIDADRFAGTLDYDAVSGKFSGTIYTESPYEGTIDDLLDGNYATLLPAGYESYDYLEIMYEGYEAHLGENAYNSFATSKKLAVEQLIFEHGSYTIGTGFVLEPQKAILNFTITGLTPSTTVTAALSDDEDLTPDIEGEVTTDGSGNATFAIGLEGSSDLNEFSLTVAGNAITLVSSSKVLTAGKIYNITRSAENPNAPLSGVFTVQTDPSTITVQFSKGNLQATYNGSAWTWGFAANQWDYIGNAAANTSINGNGTVSSNGTVDLFGWSTAATILGINNSTSNIYTGDFADWGSNATVQAGIGTGWRTLTSAEWSYLFNDRTTGGTVFGTDEARYTEATINTDGTGVNGIILFPDGVDIASGEVTTAGTVNSGSAWATKCTTAQWAALKSKGCVFLPAAGYRNGTSVSSAGTIGFYWSSTPNGSNNAYGLNFMNNNVIPVASGGRKNAGSVRLVQVVTP